MNQEKEGYAYRLETRKVYEPDFPYKNQSFSNSMQVHSFAESLQDADIEKFLILHTDGQNALICIQWYTGKPNSCIAPTREIIKHALLCSATGMIIVHNHPSSVKEFSQADRKVTKDILEACKLLEIKLLDHILVCGKEYLSMSDTGSMPL
jgi:DNA repair protein RadC